MKDEKTLGYIQTGLATIMTALVLWGAASIAELKETMAVVKDRVNTLLEKPLLTRDEFALSLQPTLDRIANNADEIQEVKTRVKNLENDLYIHYPNPKRQVNK